MKKINIIMLGLATVLMSSCGLYNKYQRPDINTTGLVRGITDGQDTLVVTDTTSFGNLPWREVFTDPQLQVLIEKGLENNPNLLNAALTIKQVEAQLACAKLAFLPSFAFAPNGTIASWNGSAAFNNKSYALPVSASWNIDLFGNILSQKRSAQMALLAGKDYQLSVKTSIIANIANLYYTLMMLDRNVEILNDMEALMQETCDKMKLMHETRIGYRSTSVQSAESSLLSIKAQKVDVVRQIRETENALSLILGESGHAIARGKLADQQLPEKFSTGIAINMLNNRPDVHYAEMSLAQCFYGVETARSKFYPSLTITPTASYTNYFGTVSNPGHWLLQAAGSLTQPIFQHGALVAGLKVAKYKYEQALNTWQNSVLSAGNEVSNALVKYNSSKEKADIEAQQIEILKKNVNDTKELMSSAGSTYLEVITAQQSLLNAEISQVTDNLYKMQAVVSLYEALGGGRE